MEYQTLIFKDKDFALTRFSETHIVVEPLNLYLINTSQSHKEFYSITIWEKFPFDLQEGQIILKYLTTSADIEMAEVNEAFTKLWYKME